MARVPYMPVPTAPVASPPARSSDYQRIDASPSAFGAQVGAAAEKTGEQIEQGTGELSQAFLQRQNYFNEIAADNAVNNYQDTLTKLQYGDPNDPSKPGFYSLKGDAAMRAYQGVTAEAEQTRQQIRSQLNLPQQKAFDAASRRMQSYALGDLGRHYNEQLNTYSIQTQQDSLKLALRNIELNPQDDTGYLHNLSDGLRAQTRMDQSAGASPQVMEYNRDSVVAKAVSARVEALTNVDAPGAMNFLEANKDSVDPVTYARLHKSIDTNLKTTSVDSAVHDTISTVNTEYRANGGVSPQQSGAGSPQYNLGNVKTLEGARANTQQFQNPATPADGVALTVNTLRGQQYAGLNLQQIGAKWSNGDPNWAQNVSKSTGIGLTDVPNLNDPATLTKLVHGIGIAEGKDLTPFTPDVINQGVQSALSGKPVNFSTVTPSTATAQYKPLATYYQENYATIVSHAQDVAAQKWPNDPDLQDRYVSGVTKSLNTTIKAQDESNKADYGAVQSYVYKNAVTSASQLQASPVAENWQRLQENMPEKAHDLEQKIMKATTSKTTTIGAGFYGLFQKVVSGEITKPSDVSSYVGDPMGVTTDGDKILTTVINESQTPQGHSQLEALGNVLKWAHGEISKTDPATGTIDSKGDARFQKYLALAVPAYFAGLKKGVTQQQLFDPKGEHSLTSLVAQFKPTAEEKNANAFTIEPGSGFTAGGQHYEAGSATAVSGEVGAALGSQAPAEQLDLHDPNAVAQAFLHGKISRDQLHGLITNHPEWMASQPSAPLVTR